jgi:hypothetical protein
MGCGNTYNSVYSSSSCLDEYGCPSGVCPDFTIKRHDTKPAFKVKIEDCDGPMDLTGLVLEASMWAKSKIKKELAVTDDYLSFADNIGFNQVMVGDIIIMDRPRLPEKMLVEGFDEENKLIKVSRGYQGTTVQKWKKGTGLRILKFSGAAAVTEMDLQDINNLDGTTTQDQLMNSYLIYEWSAQDTCLPGCYYLEFKLIKMTDEEQNLTMQATDIIPSFTDPNLTPADFGCGLGSGVEWVRRFPVSGEGFLIKIYDSITAEL